MKVKIKYIIDRNSLPLISEVTCNIDQDLFIHINNILTYQLQHTLLDRLKFLYHLLQDQ
ncbi:unnamed protein product [Tenebrio molitor]|nr:unnamed protein product [Tenebrio molitor]